MQVWRAHVVVDVVGRRKEHRSGVVQPDDTGHSYGIGQIVVKPWFAPPSGAVLADGYQPFVG